MITEGIPARTELVNPETVEASGPRYIFMSLETSSVATFAPVSMWPCGGRRGGLEGRCRPAAIRLWRCCGRNARSGPAGGSQVSNGQSLARRNSLRAQLRALAGRCRSRSRLVLRTPSPSRRNSSRPNPSRSDVPRRRCGSPRHPPVNMCSGATSSRPDRPGGRRTAPDTQVPRPRPWGTRRRRPRA